MSVRAILLDKDGTLVENVPYNVSVERLRLVEGAREFLRALAAARFRFVVVSNQSGVARGYFPESALAPIALRLRMVFAAIGAPLLDFLYCPHHPDAVLPEYRGPCECRKPAPGLLLRASLQYDIDLQQSWMVGDTLDDIEAGRRAGCRTLLVDSGGETEWVRGPHRTPHHTATNLAGAARMILAAAFSAPPAGVSR